MTPLLTKEGKVKINSVLTFSSSLRRSTLAEVPGGGGGLMRQPLVFFKKEDHLVHRSPVVYLPEYYAADYSDSLLALTLSLFSRHPGL